MPNLGNRSPALRPGQRDCARIGPQNKPDQLGLVITPLPENPLEERVEIFREYEFPSFQAAVRFMVQVAPGCDIAMHHPRWENIWKTLRVFLTTWDIGHRISDRDFQLARYFDRAYAELAESGRLMKSG
jgi:pterin-4a-carbinolamine dehydratase